MNEGVIRMWIGSYKLERNVRVPEPINDEVKKRVTKLADVLKQKLSSKFTITLKRSTQSEACYLTIRNNEGEYTISFRNHDTSASTFDIAIYLSEYRTWDDCERYFMREYISKLSELIK